MHDPSVAVFALELYSAQDHKQVNLLLKETKLEQFWHASATQQETNNSGKDCQFLFENYDHTSPKQTLLIKTNMKPAFL